jgi:hypothetical protein
VKRPSVSPAIKQIRLAGRFTVDYLKISFSISHFESDPLLSIKRVQEVEPRLLKDERSKVELGKKHKTPEWEVKGRIGSVEVSALADSGSDLEVLSASFCSQHKFKIDTSKSRTISLPGRGSVQSVGTVDLPFSFGSESKVYHRVFHVVRNCIHDVILGFPFLRPQRP